MSNTVWIIVCAIGIPAGLYACWRLLHPRVDEDPSGMTSEEIVEAMKPLTPEERATVNEFFWSHFNPGKAGNPFTETVAEAREMVRRAEAAAKDQIFRMNKPTTPHRGSRCGVCYWALYDGDWCQNKDCVMHGNSVENNRVQLTNSEAEILIKHKKL